MINKEHAIMRISTIVTGFIALSSAGCLALKTDNQLPIAEIDIAGACATAMDCTTTKTATAKSGDSTIVTAVFPFTMGTPVTATLNASNSKDPDGPIQYYTWRRTDFPAASRFAPDGGPPADSGIPKFPGDPPSGETASSLVVTQMAPGKYRYSLWVRDSYGAYSAPATVVLQVGVTPPPPPKPMPDATCLMDYTHPKADCKTCTCTPNMMGGCLDQYTACFTTPPNMDAQFNALCSAVVKCAITKNCVGNACFASPNPCMDEVMAAATYMGGTVDACTMGDTMAGTNPCAAAGALLSCTVAKTSTCATACK